MSNVLLKLSNLQHVSAGAFASSYGTQRKLIGERRRREAGLKAAKSPKALESVLSGLVERLGARIAYAPTRP